MEAESRKGRRARPSRAKPGRTHGFTVLEDVSAITARSEDLQETLQRVVEVIAERMSTEVCSLYILDPRAQRLTLWATTGLERSAVGKVTMSVEEGLTGMAIEKLEPVMAVDAITHPRYKFFPETGEEKYHSFLGVPIIERGTPIGVLVVQTLRRRRFSPHEIRILREIASKVGPIIVTARLMEDLKSKENERREFRRRMVAAIKRLQAYEKTADRAEAAPGRGRARLNGLPAAPGFGRGQAHLLQPPVSFGLVDETRADHAEEEKRRLKRALKESVAELGHRKERPAKPPPGFDGGIIDAHRLMLEDSGFARKLEAAIHDGLTAEAALKRVVEDYVEQFVRMSDGYLRDRAVDVKDVGLRILRNLLGVAEPERPLAKHSVLVAEELTLCDLALIDHEQPCPIALPP